MSAKTFIHNLLLVAVFLGFCLTNFLPDFITEIQGEGTGDYPPPNEGDWVVENETHVSNENIVLEGNLKVLESATLTLENVILQINATSNDIHGIYVYEGGTLSVYNSNITNISGPYVFTVDGNMILESSIVSNMMYGIDIEYGDVFIANSTIFNNNQYNFYGLRINGSPTLLNNFIYSNYRGIVINYYWVVSQSSLVILSFTTTS